MNYSKDNPFIKCKDICKRMEQKGLTGEITSKETSSYSVKFDNFQNKIITEKYNFSGLSLRILLNSRLGYSSSIKQFLNIDNFIDQAVNCAMCSSLISYVPFIKNNYKFFFDLEKIVTPSFETLAIYGKYLIELLENSKTDFNFKIQFNLNSVIKINTFGAELSEIRKNYNIKIDSGKFVENKYILTSKDIYTNSLDKLKIKNIYDQNHHDLILPSQKIFRQVSKKIIFMPNALSKILLMCACLWNGELAIKDLSILSSFREKKISNLNINLRDDSTIIGGCRSYSFDAEGTNGQNNYIIKNGVFTGFIHSIKSGIKLNESSTANAYSKFIELPTVDISNLVLEVGLHTFDEILLAVQNGLLIHEITISNSKNILSGDIDFKINLGYRVENSKISSIIDDEIILGVNFLKILKNIVAIGNTYYQYQNCYVPILAADC